MTTAQAVGAVSSDAAEWYAIDWQAINPLCRKRFGVLVRFAFSGMNKAGSALCAIPK
jgi:hypothetical protein